MLFEALDKLKRNAIFSTILLVSLGSIILICPEEYIPWLIVMIGYAMITFAIVQMLDFFTTKRALIHYIYFCGAMLVAIIGICVLINQENVVHVLSWLFGFLLVVDGGHSVFYAWFYTRNSQRKGWWILLILSLLLAACGVILFVNPWWTRPVSLMKVIGAMIQLSAAINALRLIWVWPLRGGAENE